MGYLAHWYAAATNNPDTMWISIGFLGQALFGVRFLIRCLDPGRVQALVRHRPDARGRTDSTIVPAGSLS